MTRGEEMKLDFQPTDIVKIRKLEHEKRFIKKLLRNYH